MAWAISVLTWKQMIVTQMLLWWDGSLGVSTIRVLCRGDK
jgi:hypothetical protein